MRSPRTRSRATLGTALLPRTLVLLTLILPLAAGLFAQEAPPPEEMTDATDALSEARILEGKIPVLDFLRFIQRSQAKLVNFPSAGGAEREFDDQQHIEVIGDIDNVTYPLVKSILEANGYQLFEEILEDGVEVINVRHVATRQKDGPKPTPLIPPGSEVGDANDQLATLVLQIKHAEMQVVVQALRELLGIGGGQNRPGSAEAVVQITNTQTLIIRAKMSILRHIQELVKYIDVEVPRPEPFFHIVSVDNADAQELVSIIQEILDVPLAPGAPRPGGGRAQPAQRAAGAGTIVEQYTRMTADIRTQKIIIDTTIEEDLELILNLISELDTEVRALRPSTNIYRVKYLKASDLAEDLQALLDGTRTAGGLRGRQQTRGRGATQQAAQQGQQVVQPSRVIPHDETNSLIIQAEYEEFLELKRVLDEIDIKRRQVFLEVALVQVNEASTLNYTLEYLAGNLDDEATRVAALTAFGLSALDPTQLPNEFDRAFSANAPSQGLFAAVSRDGRLPVLLHAIKTDTNAQIVATPFILADDNQQNTITIETEIFFSTNTLNNNFSQGGQDSEPAGITLSLLPTISENVCLLELNLEVSAFATASSGGEGNLPDRNTNTIESRVTIPDGQLFIIGGLARENESLSVSKVPILGDLPLIGRLFQSRGSNRRRDNLYVFLNVHILGDRNFGKLRDLSDQSLQGVQTFGEDIRVKNFTRPRGDDDPRGQLDPPPNPEEIKPRERQ